MKECLIFLLKDLHVNLTVAALNTQEVDCFYIQ